MLLTLCVGVLNTGGMDWLAIATLTRYATATAIPVFRSLLKQEEKDTHKFKHVYFILNFQNLNVLLLFGEYGAGKNTISTSS